MRLSVPTIPKAILAATGLSSAPIITTEEAVYRVSNFLKDGRVTLLTGAGVSVDSGIRAYRGKDGRYMNPNYKPIFYHDLVDETAKGHAFRDIGAFGEFLLLANLNAAGGNRLRSYLGYPPVRDTQPNTTHFALAALQHTGYIPNTITQNVDGLHHKAFAKFTGRDWASPDLRNSILELHGTLHSVRCKHGHTVDRETFQGWLSAANPIWKRFADDLEGTEGQLRTNPDGDVAIEHLGVSYDTFVVPECPACLRVDRRNSMHKPDLVFFGESIPTNTRDRSFQDIETGDKLLIIGTTLATYSAFRLVKHALELKKPVMMINLGPSRADDLSGIEKLDVSTSLIMNEIARAVIGPPGRQDPTVDKMLSSGINKPPREDDDDRAPRAAG